MNNANSNENRDNTFNGWANWETWNTAITLEGMLSGITEDYIEEHNEEMETEEGKEKAREDLAERMEATLWEIMEPEEQGFPLARCFLIVSLREIDFDEIAEAELSGFGY